MTTAFLVSSCGRRLFFVEIRMQIPLTICRVISVLCDCFLCPSASYLEDDVKKNPNKNPNHKKTNKKSPKAHFEVVK